MVIYCSSNVGDVVIPRFMFSSIFKIEKLGTSNKVILALLLVLHVLYSFYIILVKEDFFVNLPLIVFLQIILLIIIGWRKSWAVLAGIGIYLYYFLLILKDFDRILFADNWKLFIPHVGAIFLGLLVAYPIRNFRLERGVLAFIILLFIQFIITFLVQERAGIFLFYPLLVFVVSEVIFGGVNDKRNLRVFVLLTISLPIILKLIDGLDLGIVIALISSALGGYLIYLKRKAAFGLKSFVALLLGGVISFMFIHYNFLKYPQDHDVPMGIMLEYEDSLYQLSDLEGDIKVFDVWHRYCGPCIRGFPKVEEVAQNYEDNPDVRFYTLAAPLKDTSSLPSRQLYERLGVGVEDGYLQEQWMADSLGVAFYPTTLIVKDGRIRYKGSLSTSAYNYFNLHRVIHRLKD